MNSTAIYLQCVEMRHCVVMDLGIKHTSLNFSGVSLYNWSGLILDQRGTHTLYQCEQKLSHLVSIFKLFTNQSVPITQQGKLFSRSGWQQYCLSLPLILKLSCVEHVTWRPGFATYSVLWAFRGSFFWQDTFQVQLKLC